MFDNQLHLKSLYHTFGFARTLWDISGHWLSFFNTHTPSKKINKQWSRNKGYRLMTVDWDFQDFLVLFSFFVFLIFYLIIALFLTDYKLCLNPGQNQLVFDDIHLANTPEPQHPPPDLPLLPITTV